MVTLREAFLPSHSLKKLGAINFSTSIFKDEKRTPHFEMDQVLEMLETNPSIFSGMMDFCRFVYGTKIIVKSKEPSSKVWVDSWLNKRKNINRDLKVHLLLSSSCGNGYLQPLYKETAKGSAFDNVATVWDSSRVYVNLNQSKEEFENGENYWIYQVPQYAQRFMFMGEEYNVRRWLISYTLSSRIYTRSVYGIGLNKKLLWQYKTGWSRDGIYGRGILNSAIDDQDIRQEIMKNLAIIARNRALNIKFMQIGSEEVPDSFPDQKEIDDLQSNLQNRKESDHVIINKPLKVHDMESQGKYDKMNQDLEFVNKDMIGSMLPMYLTAWANNINVATANQIKIPFNLKLENAKEDYVDFLNETIMKELLTANPSLSKDLEFDLTVVDLDSAQDKGETLFPLFDRNGLSINELREKFGFDKIPDGDQFAKDVQPQMPMAFSANTTGAYHEALEPDSRDSVWKSRLNTKKDIKKSQTNKFKILKKKDLRGQIIRLVEEPEQIGVWNGINNIKSFDVDEKKAAESFYDVTIEKIKKSFEQFFDGKTVQDDISDELFKTIKRDFAITLDKFFKSLEKTKVKKESLLKEAFVGPKAFSSLDLIFAGFAAKLAKIIGKVKNKALDDVLNSDNPVGLDIQADKETADDLKTKYDILMDKKTVDQFKNFTLNASQDIKRMLSDASAAGKSLNQVKQEIKDKYANFKVKTTPWDFLIDRIVRTEVNGNLNLLKLKKWDMMGFEDYQWHTVEDDKVRPEHKAKNKKIFSIKDALEGKTIFPGGSLNTNEVNINCRCFPSLYN